MISVRLPRGNPPVAWSISETPVRTHSGDGRDCQSRGTTEDRFELLLQDRYRHFAFYSPVLYFYSEPKWEVNR